MTLPKHQREKHKAKIFSQDAELDFSLVEKALLMNEDGVVDGEKSSSNAVVSEAEFDADLAKLEQIALRKIAVMGNEIETRQKVEASLNKARSTEILKRWFLAHIDQPFPNSFEKDQLEEETGYTATQVKSWFSNMRKRHWYPIVKGIRKPKNALEAVIAQKQKIKISRRKVKNESEEEEESL